MRSRGEQASGAAIKAVAVDLDGTLLDNNARLPEVNAAAIRRIQALGVGVILATGKTRDAAVPIIDLLNITWPGVFFQGHLIAAADGRVLRRCKMNPQHIAEAVDYLQSRGLDFIGYDQDGLWCPAPGPYRHVIHDKYEEPLPRILSLDETVGTNKICIVAPEDKEAFREELELRFGEHMRVLPTVPEYVELLSPTVSKGEGVAWLLDDLGIDPRHLLAIGDGQNDIDMLQLAGTAVAVANAEPTVKAAADVIVAANDQGGVAEALDRFVMING